MRRERAEAFADELSRRGLAGEVVTLADGGVEGVSRLDETIRGYAGKKLGLIAVNGLVFLRLTEALARVQGASRVLVCGSLHLAGEALKLGPTEFKLLNYLLNHPERVHSRAQLLDKVWGDHVFIEERTVDVHIKRLREALGEAAVLLETVRGAGYRITAAAHGPSA